MADKLSVLRASHRVLKPAGRLGAAVITVGEGLSPVERVEALTVGPDHVDAGGGYLDLMHAAGFTAVSLIDVSDGYRETLAAWIREWDREATALRALLGQNEFEGRQVRRRRALAAAERGLLQRWLLFGRR